MFHTLSHVPSRPPPPDILREVQDLLSIEGITFGTLVVKALQSTTTSLGAAVIMELENILEALRPRFDENERARVSLGRFFASVASSELLRFGKGNETSWNLPAMNLSTERLMGFSLDEMGKKITSDAPGFSSFLGSICGGSKPGGFEADVGVDLDEVVEDDAEESMPGVSYRVLLSEVCFASNDRHL